MSAALARLGRGKITSIDRNPDLPAWVDKTFEKVPAALRQHHELIVSETSYNDELMWMIEAQTRDHVCQPMYDFCFLDGARTWEIDSCAFFLAEKLLKPGKWLLLDDLTWTLAGSSEAQKHMKSPVPRRLQETQQVMQVLKLCVAQHPNFDSVSIQGDWGWARKLEGAAMKGNAAISVPKVSLSRRAARKVARLWREGRPR